MKHFIIFPYKPLLLVCLFASILFACKTKEKPSQITNAIYVWNERSGYNYFSDEELNFIKVNNIQQVYCKLADVSWDETDHAYPHDINQLPGDRVLQTFINIVPCIFMENSVMLKSTKPELEYMAQKIAARIKNFDKHTKICQVDCDWSAASKDNYFFFLEKMKQHLDSTKLSVTLRLYQYKYPEKTGVPPADRVTLMLYNFNSPTVYRQENSIFDKAEASKYITGKKYALPMDFALPAFSWNVVYDHEDKFAGFLKLSGDFDKIEYLKLVKDHVYEVTADTVIDAYYLRKGYKLKFEEVNHKKLKEAYSLIDKFKNTDTFSVALFDLNYETLKKITEEDHAPLYNSILVK
ncbi:hypothetical protein [Cytophaga aurantiaca]|uniref:hypothetical protein n=1 Tax=Cytophaga aurantiaca TaxID=29530 RepID=UPI0003813133|nr:hypothetical protein [Cytophaga aurantiaca]